MTRPKSVPEESRATPHKPLLQALSGQPVLPVPFWFMRQAGRYLPEYRQLRARVSGFLDLCYAPDLAAEVTLQPIRRFAMDGAILFADILLVAHALGQSLDYVEGTGPVLEPIRDAGGVAALAPLETAVERLQPVAETVRKVAAALPETVTLIGFAGAPWTVATYMVEGGASPDHLTTRRWAYGGEDGFAALIERLVELTICYLDMQIEAGAEAVQIFDSWAGSLSETGFRRWCIEPVSAIVKALKKRHPKVPIIGFPKGAGALYADFARQTGVDAVGIDSNVPAGWAAAELQARVAVQGNLDPAIVMLGGAVMTEEATHILETLAKGPFVFNLGHGILQQTPPEHVAELAEQIRAWRPAAAL